MQLIWVEDSFPKKDKINSYQLDSSRTTDSISNINEKDELSRKDIKEISKFNSPKKKYNNKNKEIDELKFNLRKEKKINKFFDLSFKMRLSLILCAIYFLLFLMSAPKIPIKIGQEQNIENLIRNNSNTMINILINHFNFLGTSLDKEAQFSENVDIGKEIKSNVKKITNKFEHETSGYLLEFKTNKFYIFRWSIGFFYFIIKCICFIYSNNEDSSNLLLDKSKIDIIQKISMLLFPLSLFYFDLQNNIVYSEINIEIIKDKIIKYYIMNTKRFSMIDYVEGLIPTLFYFLISIDYNNFENIINNLGIKKQKLNKLI